VISIKKFTITLLQASANHVDLIQLTIKYNMLLMTIAKSLKVLFK